MYTPSLPPSIHERQDPPHARLTYASPICFCFTFPGPSPLSASPHEGPRPWRHRRARNRGSRSEAGARS